MRSTTTWLSLAALALIVSAPGARAADLPAPTKKVLSELKLPESTLNGLDKELAHGLSVFNARADQLS